MRVRRGVEIIFLLASINRLKLLSIWKSDLDVIYFFACDLLLPFYSQLYRDNAVLLQKKFPLGEGNVMLI